MSIQIMNLRIDKPEYEYDVRIHRRTPLGNPFKMCDESMRDEACDKYEKYFYHQIEANSDGFMMELKRLQELLKEYGGIRLFCWCAPKRCHGETIKKYLLEHEI